jgi:hypothetical protein
MPKRKPPAAKKTWARQLRDGWHLMLATGEDLRPTRELDVVEAAQLARTLPVYWFGFMVPVRELTGQSAEIAAELAKVADSFAFDTTSLYLFEAPGGVKAVVFEYHH